jgi:uncharacterized protein (DUF488 family)
MPPEDDIFTIGHSTHARDEFVRLLDMHGVGVLVDVRQYPRSRRVPQFNTEALAREFPSRGIEYLHLRELGGRRRPLPDSPNGGWTNDQFRGYADHMTSHEFKQALGRLEELGRSRAAAIMCAEALWFRCHRRLVADALVVRGWRVLHIGSDGRLAEHELTPFAVISHGELTYPPEQTSLGIQPDG